MKFEVYEDGSGMLHLFVWDEEALTYYNYYLDPMDAAVDVHHLMEHGNVDGWTLPDMDIDPLEHAREIYPALKQDATLIMDEATMYLDEVLGFAAHEMIKHLVTLTEEEE